MPLIAALALTVAHAVVPGAGPAHPDAPMAVELPAEAPPARGLMLETGLFHGDEVPAPAAIPATGWVALVADQERLHLVDAAVQARVTVDPIVDGPGEATGTEVRGLVAEGAGEPVLLLHGLGLHPGPVAGEWPVTGLLSAGTRHLLAGASQLVVTDGDGVADPARVDARSGVGLVLQREEADGTLRLQHLDALPPASPDGGPYLLWSGDLDGDGHTDLLLELDTSYNRSRTVLLLSGHAAEGELVGVAAELDTTGC